MKVGVALGGGGVRGLAHVLALETIDACGVVPAMLSGTSMGAIVGALYASGKTGQEIRSSIEKHIVLRGERFEQIYQKKHELIKWLKIVRPAWTQSGMIRADGFLHYLLEELNVETFEELKIPLKVMATDFYQGTPVVFDSGELLPAIQASMSIPGIFVPVEHDGRILVDGGVVDNLPYDLLQDDCDVTIAIDVSPTREPGEEKKMPNVIDATLGMFDTLVDRATKHMIQERPPTIYIRPRLTGIRALDFEKIETVFVQAEPAMEELKCQLKEIMKNHA